MKSFILSFFVLLSLFSFDVDAQQNCDISIQGIVKNTSCTGGMDGSVRIQVRGGAAPYSYQWNSGREGTFISQLTEGTYTITVRDKNGCKGIQSFAVNTESTEALKLQVDQQPVGGGRTKLKATFIGGRKPYSVQIKRLSDGIRAPFNHYTGQPLASGIYLLEAFTEAGCSVIQKVTLHAN